jgi:hypothetical protein
MIVMVHILFAISSIPLLTRLFGYLKNAYVCEEEFFNEIPRNHRCIRRVSLLSLEEELGVHLQVLG